VKKTFDSGVDKVCYWQKKEGDILDLLNLGISLWRKQDVQYYACFITVKILSYLGFVFTENCLVSNLNFLVSSLSTSEMM
jgi:hypothetical protein